MWCLGYSFRPMSVTAITSTPKYLDWKERPEGMERSISNAFEGLAKQTRSSWGLYNGGREYGMCGVDEHKLIKKMIQEAPPTQKEFYVLEIGAGNFEWENGIASYINQQTDLPSDIKVHVIGVRGETNLAAPIREVGKCRVYNFGAFKCEELQGELEKLGLFLENKIDFIVSRWALRHFVDPVGAFSQAFHLLKAKGFMALDGFFFLHQNEGFERYLNSALPQRRFVQLLIDTRAPFLVNFFNGARSLDRFILQKPVEGPCPLPMSYMSISYVDEHSQIGSHCVTAFDRTAQEYDKNKLLYECDYESFARR